MEPREETFAQIVDDYVQEKRATGYPPERSMTPRGSTEYAPRTSSRFCRNRLFHWQIYTRPV